MVDFASLDGMGGNIPSSGGSVDPMSLTTPNSMITGTMAGLQQIGSPSLTVDSVKNLITVKPISTTGTQILRYGQVATGFLGMAVNDGTNDTMFAGQDNTGATVVKIAKSGFDAKTATPDQLVFNSSQDVFKIIASGTYTTTSSFSTTGTPTGGHVTESFNHGLSSIPVVMAFIISSGRYFALPFLTFNEGTTYQGLSITVSSDANQVYFTLATYNQGSNWGNTPIKYYLLQETAN